MRRYILDKNKYLTPSEIKKLEKTMKSHPKMSERTKVLFEVALLTGAKAIELLKLKVSDVLPEGKTIFIHGLARGSQRELPLPPALWRRVRKLGEMDPNGVVFSYSYEWLKKEWAKYRPNPKKSFYSIRHTAGLRLYEKTGDINLVQAVLGHKNLQNMQIYVGKPRSTQGIKQALAKK